MYQKNTLAILLIFKDLDQQLAKSFFKANIGLIDLIFCPFDVQSQLLHYSLKHTDCPKLS